ncbi:MAG TPA: alpha/beta hydrolase, partial [Azospirillaceae bacterium]|nr:alpha/beta hydrolase [Azospirillaceae bacterium]
PYAKRAMAMDQVEVMAALGFRRFALVGHDRGARVACRLALDHPGRVERLAILDIVPTLTIFDAVNQTIATDLWHWFFLIQPRGFPEHLMGCDPEYALRRFLGSWGANPGAVTEAAFYEYLRCFRDHATLHAMCEDYRAAATVDLEHDRTDRAAGRKVGCPTLTLWGRQGVMARHFDVLKTWRDLADPVTGRALDCGHYLPEERPEETAAALEEFLEA